MTNKTSMAHLRNTFMRLNNLVGKQKEETDENVTQARTIMSSNKQSFMRNPRKETIVVEDSDGLSHGSDSVNPKKEKLMIEQEVKRIEKRRSKLTTAPHMKTSKFSVATSEKTNELHLGHQSNLENSKLLLPKKPLTHMQKLKEIENRIKLDLSDTKLKREHFQMLSTSMSKLSSGRKMTQL